MKKIIGFIILLVVFVACAACTQQATPAPVTTPPTTIPTPVPTTEITLVPTTLPKTVVTTVLPTATRTESPQTKLLTRIQMKNNAFVPQELVALPGSGITWINDDTTAHSLKMSFSDGGFNTGDILPGSQWSYDFGKREGTYNISCIYHPEMKGTVVIKKTASILGNPQK